MNAKELFETTMNPAESQTVAHRYDGCRRSGGNVYQADGRRSRTTPAVHRGQCAERAQFGCLSLNYQLQITKLRALNRYNVSIG